MFKLYGKFQEVQLKWIRKHPMKWLILNLVLTVLFIGYVEYKDRQWMRELDEDISRD